MYNFLVFDYVVICMYCEVKTITSMLYRLIISSNFIADKNKYRQVHQCIVKEMFLDYVVPLDLNECINIKTKSGE